MIKEAKIDMKTHVEFRTNKFFVYNNNNFSQSGRHLVEYIKKKLEFEGINTFEFYPKERTWILPVQNDLFDMWIECRKYDEYPDGFLLSIEPAKPVVQKYHRRINTVWSVTYLANILDQILSKDPEIGEIEWWQEDKKRTYLTDTVKL